MRLSLPLAVALTASWVFLPGIEAVTPNRIRLVPDTLPEHVIQRSEDAFNRHDAKALGALYAPTAVLSFVGADSTARNWPASPDSVAVAIARYWTSQKKPPTIKHLQRMSAGPFVADKYELHDDRGATYALDIYEVRGGLIVREWQPLP